MKIRTAQENREADVYTIQQQKISSWQLMERASRAVFDQLSIDFGMDQPFIIYCGPGNNGGDGLAIARMLHLDGKQVKVFRMAQNHYSTDNIINQELLHELGVSVLTLSPSDEIEPLQKDRIILDALFGNGLTRPVHPEWRPIFDQINQHQGPVVSIDIPSGMYADHPSDPGSIIIHATHTYSFQSPKMSLLQPENGSYTGWLSVLDIGLETSLEEQVSKTQDYYTDMRAVQSYIPKKIRFAHKGTFGHVLIIGGSYGKIGAPLLSSRAALRTGCGLVTAFVPACGYSIIQTSFPEAMVTTDDKDVKLISNFPDPLKMASTYQAIGLGMGMGQAPETANAFRCFLQAWSTLNPAPPLVLDADALNIIAEHPELLSLLPSGTILTPHPKELKRLIGDWTDDWDKLKKTKAFTKRFGIISLIKGANTAIVCPNGEIHFNATGNWGMATGGSGDVLTGLIASLLAQGYSSQVASILGVFIHGLAGDLATASSSAKGLIASDIIDKIPMAWETLMNQRV